MTRTGGSEGPAPTDNAAHAFTEHSSGKRISTDVVITNTLREQYPSLQLTICPVPSCQLLNYAAAGHAAATPLADAKDPQSLPLTWRQWLPPASRLGGSGLLVERVFFGKYMYKWKSHEFVLYVVNGRDGFTNYPEVYNNYILSTDENITNQLIAECSRWSYELHNEVWIFDGGYWSKSADLYRSIQGASWKNVILEEDKKKAIQDDVADFFSSRATYERLQVPWKRGLIFHGPPGNGKTISIKAIMHDLYQKKPAFPTLYVRSLASFAGPEYSIKAIFARARMEAPCFLVFEDLDSVVTDQVRSYFLNEVDGIKGNDGILMVGSTNHLDQLDPGLSKRPSRFDRKYLFPDPSLPQRVAYAKFWQHKLSSNSELEFPDKLCPAVANITQGFSFAYIQEAFVASLLAIARDSGNDKENAVATETAKCPDSPEHETSPPQAADEYKQIMQKLQEQTEHYHEILAQLERKGIALEGDEDPDLDKLPLWRELKKQIAILRDGMDDKTEVCSMAKPVAVAPLQAPPPPPPARLFQAIAPLGSKQPHEEHITQWLQSLDMASAAAAMDGGAQASTFGNKAL